jgi:hypothetical protein
MFINLFARLNYTSLSTGVETILSKENDKILYLDYLIELTKKLIFQEYVNQRDIEILTVDVYGNLACILKGKINEEIIRKFIELAKLTLKLTLPSEVIINLPIKLLS